MRLGRIDIPFVVLRENMKKTCQLHVLIIL